jgi:hypothetical protein
MLEKESGASGEIDLHLKVKIWQENHYLILGGHRSMKKKNEAIRRHYRYPIIKEVEEVYENTRNIN